MLGVTVPRDEYVYSRSITLRTYAFLTAFAASAWWYGSTGRVGPLAESARFVFFIALAISVAYLWRWTNRRHRIEYAVIAVLTAVLYPVVFWLVGSVEGVGGDAINIGVFLLTVLALFLKLPTPKPAPPAV